MNYIKEYNNEIVLGRIKVSKHIRMVYSKLAKACDDPDGQYCFDEFLERKTT